MNNQSEILEGLASTILGGIGESMKGGAITAKVCDRLTDEGRGLRFQLAEAELQAEQLESQLESTKEQLEQTRINADETTGEMSDRVKQLESVLDKTRDTLGKVTTERDQLLSGEIETPAMATLRGDMKMTATSAEFWRKRSEETQAQAAMTRSESLQTDALNFSVSVDYSFDGTVAPFGYTIVRRSFADVTLRPNLAEYAMMTRMREIFDNADAHKVKMTAADVLAVLNTELSGLCNVTEEVVESVIGNDTVHLVYACHAALMSHWPVEIQDCFAEGIKREYQQLRWTAGICSSLANR